MNRAIAALITVTTLSALGPACANDQAGKFQDYVERSEPFRATVATAACEQRFDVSGDYLIAVSTHLARDKPLLLDATFSVDTTAWTIRCDFHLVNMTDESLADRADVGELFSATAPLADDGSFSLDFGTVDVPAAANPITFSDIQANLVLAGCTKGAELVCGPVEGNVVAPEIDLETSTWGASPIVGDIVTTAVVTSCADAAAQ